MNKNNKYNFLSGYMSWFIGVRRLGDEFSLARNVENTSEFWLVSFFSTRSDLICPWRAFTINSLLRFFCRSIGDVRITIYSFVSTLVIRLVSACNQDRRMNKCEHILNSKRVHCCWGSGEEYLTRQKYYIWPIEFKSCKWTNFNR